MRMHSGVAATRGWLLRHWLTPVVGLCAAAPVIVSTSRAVSDGWMPAGDQANIATRAYDVLTSRTPLVGLHSDVSAVTHQAVYSLGPMLFWLLALPARTGSPGTLIITMGLLNTASIVGALALARRRGGRALMFLTAIGIVLMSRSLSPEVLHDVWNPSAGLFPFLLLVFLGWSLACGEYRLLPITVLLASFVVQCQLAFVPPSVGVLAIGLIGLALSLWRGRARRAGDASEARRSVWRWLLAALLVAAVCWAPPAIEQIDGTPGNLTAVIRTASANPPTLGWSVGWHAVVRAIGIPPWWLRDPASPWERKNEVRVANSTLATASTVVMLAALVVLGVVGVLRRRAELWAGALIALALCGGLATLAASTPTMRVLAETLGYTMWWGSPAGMFVWVLLAWAATKAIPRVTVTHRRVVALASAAGVVAAGASATAVAATLRPDYHLPEYRPLDAVYAALDRTIPARRTVLLIGSLDSRTFRFKMAARFALVKRGIRPLSPGTDVRLGGWYELRNRHYDCVVYVKDGSRSPTRRTTMIARVTFDDGTGSYPVSVWTSAAGCPRPRAGTTVAPNGATARSRASCVRPEACRGSPRGSRARTPARAEGR
jgi:hypothetical protein